MLTSYSTSYKTLVFAKNSLKSNVPVGILLDFVVNPDSGVFEGIWIKTTSQTGILSMKDILNWDQEGIFITQESEIVASEEFPRIQKVLEKEVPILGAVVFTQRTKKQLGTVEDFSFDTISPRILSIKVRSGFWLFGRERLIGRSQIKKITEEGILVSEPTIKIKDGKKETNSVEKKLKSSVDSVQQSVKKGYRDL